MSATNGNRALTHFGKQMKKERLARGWSLREFAARSGIDHATASLIETGKRQPNERVAKACDRVFPERNGWFLEYYEESKDWVPAGLRDWSEYEDRAKKLLVWSTSVVDGLLQTPEYARAQLQTVPGVTDEMIAARLANRMARQQRILDRDDVEAWFIVDEVSLYRYTGSHQTMATQIQHLADAARRPNVTIQVLPVVAHPATASSFMVSDHEACYIDHIAGGLVYTADERVSTMIRLFDTLRGESYRVSESLKMLERLPNIWTGERPPIPAPRADSA